jgi:hypothetical protein
MVDYFNGKFRFTSGVGAELEHIAEENPWLPETDEEVRGALAEKIQTANRNPDTAWQINKIDPQDPESEWVLSCNMFGDENATSSFSSIRELLYHLDDLLRDEEVGQLFTLPDAYEMLDWALRSSLPMNVKPDEESEEREEGTEGALIDMIAIRRTGDEKPN